MLWEKQYRGKNGNWDPTCYSNPDEDDDDGLDQGAGCGEGETGLVWECCLEVVLIALTDTACGRNHGWWIPRILAKVAQWLVDYGFTERLE